MVKLFGCHMRDKFENIPGFEKKLQLVKIHHLQTVKEVKIFMHSKFHSVGKVQNY